MAKQFIPSQFFKKITNTKLLSEYYFSKNISGFFEIPETTPKKEQINLMAEFWESLNTEQKIETTNDFLKILKLGTNKNINYLTNTISKEKKIEKDLSEFVEGNNFNKSVYYLTSHEEIIDDVLFVSSFYELKGYKTYEAKEKTSSEIEMNISKLKREFEKVLRKENRARFYFLNYKFFDGDLYLLITYEDYPQIGTKIDWKEEELFRNEITRPLKESFFIYHKDTNEIDIKSSGSKKEKDIFLETVLLNLFDMQLTTKKQKYDISKFENRDFELKTNNSKNNLLSYRITAISFTTKDTKQKIRVTTPKSKSLNDGSKDIWNLISDMGFENKIEKINSVTINFRLSDTNNSKGVYMTNCSIKNDSCSLSNLTKQEREIKKILKESEIDLGFVEDEQD